MMKQFHTLYLNYSCIRTDEKESKEKNIILSLLINFPCQIINKKNYNFMFFSGSTGSPYETQPDGTTTSTTTHANGFPPRSPQTEPVDFSGPRPLGFSLMGGPNLPPAPYSRESTPDSGGSHYIENYRDPSGKYYDSISDV